MIDTLLTWPTLLSSVKKNGVHLIFYKSPKVFLSQILSWTNTGVGGHVCSKLDLRRSFYNNRSWCCDHNKWYFKLCITDLQRGGGGVGSRWRATTRTSTPCSAWASPTSPRSREPSDLPRTTSTRRWPSSPTNNPSPPMAQLTISHWTWT